MSATDSSSPASRTVRFVVLSTVISLLVFTHAHADPIICRGSRPRCERRPRLCLHMQAISS
ncbi:unnamed protein product [Protopolystoma xenopodis]|uniref:Uncharacterized protein n=1 Tax=Protopolystoma xenopodis TaxID=117903 RepID=A0A3S5BLR6_9PLAT|nr:unnamed protein product [Protopolystoma xenopodis]